MICEPTPIDKRTGEMASGVVNRILRDAQACAVRNAISKVRCATRPGAGVGGVPESMRLLADVSNCYIITSEKAIELASIGLRGVTSSVRTARLEYDTVMASYSPTDPTSRFVAYQGRFIPPACPPPSAEQLNANLPKPTTSCITALPSYLRPSL